MENHNSNWNGFQIHGDTAELDKIVENSGVISLDLYDIINTLSASGENHIMVGVGASISEAFKIATDTLPISISDVEKLLIQFYFGTKQSDVSELSVITDTLGKANQELSVVWGITNDEGLGENVKVVLLAS